MISIFDLFKIGIGPSSSHTMGPMKAAAMFMSALDDGERRMLDRLQVTLLGSLGYRSGHAGQIQGNIARRARGERARLLKDLDAVPLMQMILTYQK